jgi:hypothetical protein
VGFILACISVDKYASHPLPASRAIPQRDINASRETVSEPTLEAKQADLAPSAPQKMDTPPKNVAASDLHLKPCRDNCIANGGNEVSEKAIAAAPIARPQLAANEADKNKDQAEMPGYLPPWISRGEIIDARTPLKPLAKAEIPVKEELPQEERLGDAGARSKIPLEPRLDASPPRQKEWSKARLNRGRQFADATRLHFRSGRTAFRTANFAWPGQ